MYSSHHRTVWHRPVVLYTQVLVYSYLCLPRLFLPSDIKQSWLAHLRRVPFDFYEPWNRLCFYGERTEIIQSWLLVFIQFDLLILRGFIVAFWIWMLRVWTGLVLTVTVRPAGGFFPQTCNCNTARCRGGGCCFTWVLFFSSFFCHSSFFP